MNMLTHPRKPYHSDPGLAEFAFAVAALACAVLTGFLLLAALAAL